MACGVYRWKATYVKPVDRFMPARNAETGSLKSANVILTMHRGLTQNSIKGIVS
jgi:hypothetical protein